MYTQQQQPNVSACICKQANVSLPWRRSRQSAMPMRACVRQMTHKPTDIRQRITASSRSAAKHQQTSPKMLGQFPLRPTGAAEACAGPESCCGSAAPTASPRTLFQRLLRCVTAHKRLVVLSSRVSSVQNSPDRQTRRAGGSSIYQDWLDMSEDGCNICEVIGSKFCLDFSFLRDDGWEGPDDVKRVEWLYRIFGDTLHVGPRWRFHCGGFSVRGWRFHSRPLIGA